MWLENEKPSVLLPKLTPWETALTQSGLPVCLFGTGNGADKIMDCLQSLGIRVSGVFSSDPFVRDRSFRGFRVESRREMEDRLGKAAVLLCFGLSGEEGYRLLDGLAERHLVISPSSSVCGRDMRDMSRLLSGSGLETLDRIDGWLSDDLSKELFRRVLCWKVTGDHRWLDGPGGEDKCPDAYYAHSRIHVDVGAYDGDTVREYLSANPSVERIMAFEPDGDNFRRLQAGTDPSRVDCFLAACSDRNGVMPFEGGRGRGSAAGAQPRQTVPTWKLDTICGHAHLGDSGKDVGSLKIDAEGMDRQVLFGAANLITDCRPVVRVSAYHKEEDLTEIPGILKRYVYQSELYFRKKPCVPAWDTEYVFVPAPRGRGRREAWV